MNLKPFVSHLRRSTGLDAASLGEAAIRMAVEGRRRGMTPEEYFHFLDSDPCEAAALAEAVSVPETWLFRYPESFRYLAALLTNPPWERPPGDEPLRLLSLPCSTGEEAYSLAATLLAAGFGPRCARVDGVDLNAKSLEAARRGVFGAFSRREGLPSGCERYFDANGAARPDLRSLIDFSRGNLIDPGFAAGRPAYQVIFCRNLFIYLAPEARRAAVRAIEAMLAPGGLVFLGHSESEVLPSNRFAPVGPPGAFAFSRRAEDARTPVPLRFDWPGCRIEIEAAPPPEPASASRPEPSPIDEVERLASAGRLAEAEAVCRSWVAAAPTAGGFVLLGTLLGMSNRPEEAEAAFRRALYLDPKDALALHQMGALLAGRGDTAGADRYLKRAGRLQGGEA